MIGHRRSLLGGYWCAVGHRFLGQLDAHAARIGKLDRVVDQINQNLAERPSIRTYEDWLGGRTYRKLEPFLLGQRS
jgi:hypothetical protein